jgi:hypothetical protein
MQVVDVVVGIFFYSVTLAFRQTIDNKADGGQ